MTQHTKVWKKFKKNGNRMKTSTQKMNPKLIGLTYDVNLDASNKWIVLEWVQ